MITIIFIILTFLIALIIGLLLRRVLIRALQKTVLDTWIIQTLGAAVVLPTLILAGFATPVILDPNYIVVYWHGITQRFPDLTGLATNVIATLLLIGLSVGFARTARALTVRGLGENRIDINIRTLIGRVFYFLILLIAIFWILSIWQIPLQLPVTIISVITVAVTVAIQDILKDLVAGFYILIERPFRIGDQINTVTYTGKVEDVQLRATKLRLVSGEEVTIPNSLVFGSTVVNNSFYGERRATITVTMPETEFVKGETPDQLLKAVKTVENVMVKPEPAVMLTGYVSSKATITVRFWIASGQISTVTEVLDVLHDTLPDAELTILESAGNV